jgi:hypothetical protein
MLRFIFKQYCSYSALLCSMQLLAKVGSARNKPNQQTIILPRAVAKLLR